MIRRAFTLLALAAVSGLLLAEFSPAAEPTALEARAALEACFAKAAKVQTVQADFDQLRKLKSVRNPLRKPGQLWMDKAAGLFRWQVGEPPEILALRSKEGGMTVLETKKKEARTWTKEALEAEEKQGRGQGFAMLSSMQNASLADFDRDFELIGWKRDEANSALWAFDWKFRDGKIGLFVLKLTVVLNSANGALQSFTVNMRDGSSMSTVVKSYKLNAPIPADTFKVDMTGYEVEAMTPKS